MVSEKEQIGRYMLSCLSWEVFNCVLNLVNKCCVYFEKSRELIRTANEILESRRRELDGNV